MDPNTAPPDNGEKPPFAPASPATPSTGLNQRVGGPILLAFLLLSAVLTLMCCAANGLGAIIHIPLTFAFGWAQYLNRVVPQLQPDPWAVATAAACLLGVVFGGHAFLRWLYASTAPGPEPRRWPWRRTLLLVGLVVLMFVSGIAVTGVVHQTGWLFGSKEPIFHSRMDAPARSRSQNNLKQIGIGAHAMHDATDHLPRSTFDPTGRPMHSWQTHLLPYVEQDPLFKRIDLSKPWTDPGNAAPLATPVSIFQNPGIAAQPVSGYAVCHYAGNARVMLSDTPLTMTGFPQGTSNTILAGEVAANFRAWGDPLNARDPRLGTDHPDGFGGPNRPPLFLLLDGSVRQYNARELADLVGKVPE